MTAEQFVAKLYAMGEQTLAAGQDPVSAWYRSNQPGQMIDILREMQIITDEDAEMQAHSWFPPERGVSYAGWHTESFAYAAREQAAQTAADAYGPEAAEEAMTACRLSNWMDRTQAIYYCSDQDRYDADRDAHFAVMGAVRAAFAAYHQALQEQLLQVWQLTTPQQLLAALASA